MTTRRRSGLMSLVESVREYLSERDPEVEVRAGWHQRDRVDNQAIAGANRVVFTPSDDNGAGGRISGIRGPGLRSFEDGDALVSSRGLYNWDRLVVVSVWASTLDRENEEEQIEATELLFEDVMQAVQASAYATAQWGAINWTPPPERAFGRELRVALTFKHPMLGEEYEVVIPTTGTAHRGTTLGPIET